MNLPKVKHECGVIGVMADKAGQLAVMGLQALQHRGQESAGVASFDGTVHIHKAMGLVDAVFASHPDLPGRWAVGHNRYSTCGSSEEVNAGPFYQDTPLGPLVVAHNGNIFNAPALADMLDADYDVRPASTSDTELLSLLLKVAPGNTWTERVRWMAGHALGSYSLVLLTNEGLIGVRDEMGNRPLALAHLQHGWALVSESCALSLLGGTLARDIEPGEIIEVNEAGPKPLGSILDVTNAVMPREPIDTAATGTTDEGRRTAFCAFESIYIARPDTVFAGRTVHSTRRAIGEELGREHPVKADLVIGVPDSGTSSALGYSTSSGVPFGEGLIKNRYIGRTFIHPAQAERERLIRMKFGALPLHGKRIVLVDDSIVRGNTLGPIVTLLREAGASEIHVRIAAPPFTDPCYFGVDMPNHDDMIANRLTQDELGIHVGADSLKHVSIEGLLRALRGTVNDTCLGCFTGRYPMKLEPHVTATRARPAVKAAL